jgi:hypothetical protein
LRGIESARVTSHEKCYRLAGFTAQLGNIIRGQNPMGSLRAAQVIQGPIMPMSDVNPEHRALLAAVVAEIVAAITALGGETHVP